MWTLISYYVYIDGNKQKLVNSDFFLLLFENYVMHLKNACVCANTSSVEKIFFKFNFTLNELWSHFNLIQQDPSSLFEF